ncbi:hypothetical protein GCM10010505_63730 [Kitasatospora aburaviensis]
MLPCPTLLPDRARAVREECYPGAQPAIRICGRERKNSVAAAMDGVLIGQQVRTGDEGRAGGDGRRAPHRLKQPGNGADDWFPTPFTGVRPGRSTKRISEVNTCIYDASALIRLAVATHCPARSTRSER